MQKKLKKIIGVILILLGLLGGIVPLVHGWLLILLGLALLESAYVDKQVKRAKKLFASFWKKSKK